MPSTRLVFGQFQLAVLLEVVREPRSLAELARGMRVTPSRLARAVGWLHQNGMLSPGDNTLQPSDQGRRFCGHMRPPPAAEPRRAGLR